MLTISQPAGAKSTSSPGSISDKQRGLSNTQTKHSTDIDNDPGKSKKGEGYAETAKAQGAVDPQRPMVRTPFNCYTSVRTDVAYRQRTVLVKRTRPDPKAIHRTRS